MKDQSAGSSPPRFLTAEWKALAMLNYEVDPRVLAARVPAGTELDAWNGRTLVSMVGFSFLGTRVLGVPAFFHRDFEEVNLRFYVRRRAAEGWRRGVVFVREIVPRPLIAWLARSFYNEQYVAMPMRHLVELPSADRPRGAVRYEWRSQARWNRLAVAVEAAPRPVDDGSEESFITEHYWGYTRQRDGSTLEYGVQHSRWGVWVATRAELDCDVAGLYGPEFGEFLARPPASAFVADGSAVTVRRGRRIA